MAAKSLLLGKREDTRCSPPRIITTNTSPPKCASHRSRSQCNIYRCRSWLSSCAGCPFRWCSFLCCCLCSSRSRRSSNNSHKRHRPTCCQRLGRSLYISMLLCVLLVALSHQLSGAFRPGENGRISLVQFLSLLWFTLSLFSLWPKQPSSPSLQYY